MRSTDWHKNHSAAGPTLYTVILISRKDLTKLGINPPTSVNRGADFRGFAEFHKGPQVSQSVAHFGDLRPDTPIYAKLRQVSPISKIMPSVDFERCKTLVLHHIRHKKNLFRENNTQTQLTPSFTGWFRVGVGLFLGGLEVGLGLLLRLV